MGMKLLFFVTEKWVKTGGVKGKEGGGGKENNKSKATIIVIPKAKQMCLFARESRSIGAQQLTSVASLQQVIFLKDNKLCSADLYFADGA